MPEKSGNSVGAYIFHTRCKCSFRHLYKCVRCNVTLIACMLVCMYIHTLLFKMNRRILSTVLMQNKFVVLDWFET
jgi:hypothetical protein